MPSILLSVLLLILGLVILIFSGDALVRGATNIAYKMKLSPLVVGLTIVAFGTSAPELIVSLKSVLSGKASLGMGNVVGSNICNLSLVLGSTALVYPIFVKNASVKIDWIVAFGSSLLLFFFIGAERNHANEIMHLLNRFEGIILFLILVIYTYFLIENSRKEVMEKEAAGLPIAEEDEMEDVENAMKSKNIVELGFILIGCVGLYFGGEMFVENAADLAALFGNATTEQEIIDQQAMIGATVVAFGTSAPELVTSIIAARKKNTDLALGNLLGSCIFNVLSILGLTAIIAPGGIVVEDTLVSRDMLMMLGVILLVLPMMISRKKITAIEGGLLLVVYVMYVSFKITEILRPDLIPL